ncbi:unnamed protein product, partial [Mesorhabditis belari]|uniref:Ig-like domain-containing protein n=1 Tax=Mesorhabditis belari TaxID=2138241 RepID=A0AAF3FAC4_9BILA
MKNLINSTYDHRIRPYTLDSRGKRKPIEVTANIYLRQIPEISTKEMKIKAQITFRQEWIDPRLAYKSISNSRKYPSALHLTKRENENLVWLPDTFFQNSLDESRHNVQVPNVLIRVDPDGRVLYSERIGLTLSCPMILTRYPFDRQVCHLDFASYSFTEKDIIYKWKKDNPVQIKAGLTENIPNFLLEPVETENCRSSTNSGTYSCLRVKIPLKRISCSELLQLYIPSTMLVICSWAAFFFNKRFLSAKTTIVMLVLVSMILLSSFENQRAPATAYNKSIDCWIGVCFLFVFMALVEVAAVAFFEQTKCCEQGNRGNEITQKNEYEALVPSQVESNRHFDLRQKWKNDPADAIDFFSRIVFPSAFFLYIIVYAICVIARK